MLTFKENLVDNLVCVFLCCCWWLPIYFLTFYFILFPQNSEVFSTFSSLIRMWMFFNKTKFQDLLGGFIWLWKKISLDLNLFTSVLDTMSNGKKVILWLGTSGSALHLLSDLLASLTTSFRTCCNGHPDNTTAKFWENRNYWQSTVK